jgi:hypothetical protein
LAKKKEKYTQCGLSRGNEHTVSWIPEKFARLGKTVDLYSGSTDSWEKGWLVENVWSTITLDELIEQQKQSRNTRKASDV